MAEPDPPQSTEDETQVHFCNGGEPMSPMPTSEAAVAPENEDNTDTKEYEKAALQETHNIDAGESSIEQQSVATTEETRLFVGNLSFQAESEELLNAFAQFNPILADIIVRDGTPLGYGFIEFASVEEAQSTLSALSKSPLSLHGRVLRVQPAQSRQKHRHPSPAQRRIPHWKETRQPSWESHQLHTDEYADEADIERTIFVANLPYQLQDEELFHHFQPFAATSARIVWYPSGESQGFGFITFNSAADREQVLCLQTPIYIHSRAIVTHPANSRPSNPHYQRSFHHNQYQNPTLNSLHQPYYPQHQPHHHQPYHRGYNTHGAYPAYQTTSQRSQVSYPNRKGSGEGAGHFNHQSAPVEFEGNNQESHTPHSLPNSPSNPRHPRHKSHHNLNGQGFHSAPPSPHNSMPVPTPYFYPYSYPYMVPYSYHYAPAAPFAERPSQFHPNEGH